MTKQEFKQMFIKIINYGWSGTDYFSHLNVVAQDDKLLSEVFNRAKLVSYRAHISLNDATFLLIRRGDI